MRLALVSPVFPPYRSGQGTVARENAEMAGENEIETVVYTPRYKKLGRVLSRESMRGYQIERLSPFCQYGNAAFLPQLFWKLRSASVVHLHYPCLGMEIPVLFWRMLGKRVVVTYHMDLVGNGVFMRNFFWLYSKIFLPLVMKSAACIFVTSYDYAEHSRLIRPFAQKMREKFVELPCSVRTDIFFPTVQPAQPLTPYILFVGALDSAHYSKGVPALLEAMRKLFHVIPREAMNPDKMSRNFLVCLVIIGDGNLRKEYERQAESLGITDSVRFIGSVSPDELARLYTSALCLVLPSTDSTEAFGVVIIEAAASGTPTIATRLPGVRSVIEDGATGFLVEPNNADALAEKIAFFVSHPERAREMGAAARKRAEERYSYNVVKEIYINKSMSSF